MLERQRAGQRREREAALRVRRGAQIIGDQPQLVVAAGLIGEAVEQLGELVHGVLAGLAVGRAVALVLVAVADDGERPRLQSARLAPMHQRVLLAVRHPDFGRAGRRDGGGQPVPVGVVGDHQRKFDAALAGARPHPHPAGGEARHRIGKAPRPHVLQGRRRAERDRAGKLRLVRAAHRLELAEIDAAAAVIARDLLHRAVQIDRLVVAGLADQRDHALRLAERIGADQMRALGKHRDGMQELGDLARRHRRGGTPAGRTSPR